MHEGRCESLSGLNCKKARVKKILVSNFGGSVLLRGKCFAEGNVFRRRKCVSQEEMCFAGEYRVPQESIVFRKGFCD